MVLKKNVASKLDRKKTHENVLNEIDETSKTLCTVKERKWNMIGHVLRHEEELMYIIIEGKINGKRDRVMNGEIMENCITNLRLHTYIYLKKVILV